MACVSFTEELQQSCLGNLDNDSNCLETHKYAICVQVDVLPCKIPVAGT